MATPTVIISNPQNRVKDTYAAAPNVGLVVRANGEEQTSIITVQGNVQQAGIPNPTVVPTLAATTGGSMTVGQYVGYLYVYAATTAYPYVNSTNAINGSLAPRSNQSPGANIIVGSGQAINVTVTYTARTDITEIWIFRTNYFASALEAQTAADAGATFYVGEIANNTAGGTGVFKDISEFTGPDEVEIDNFVAPTFQFVVYYDPYWWGFGNFPFQTNATWATTGIVTITAPDKWFIGRNGQNISLAGITTGGYDGQGTFQFLWLTSTTAQLTLDGTSGTAQTLSAAGSGAIIIQGPAVTLYRSKQRNPLAWGYTSVIGSSNVPIEYAFQVGGGVGTALAVVPNTSLLNLDCEYPAICFTMNLKLAGTAYFEQSLRIISDQYSVSSHWSQFAATTQQGFSVLWGIDYKNFAILQSNGVMQFPISGPIPKILRRLTTNRSSQLACHGVSDSRTELNCLWVTTNDSLSIVNYLIYQHWPTGYWGFINDKDILSSALIQDTLTGQNKTFVGTQTGLFGQAFVDDLFSNWNPPTGTMSGTVASATTNTLSISTGSFNTTDDGLIGNWCLITDGGGQTEQWARIAAVSSSQISFDLIYPALGGNAAQFNPTPQAGYQFYIGMIECRLRKDFDLDQPMINKSVIEFWTTQDNAAPGDSFVRFWRDRRQQYQQQFAILQNAYVDLSESDVWSQKTGAPQLPSKSFGLEIINRSYADWHFVNFLFKTNVSAG